MRTLYWIIPSIVFLYVLIFVVIIPQIRIKRCRKFRENMKPGMLCKVYYGEETYLGTIKESRNTAGEDMGLGNIYITVSFRDTEDYPRDENDHKIIAKTYKREDIYPGNC
jgi:hypothetical protein